MRILFTGWFPCAGCTKNMVTGEMLEIPCAGNSQPKVLERNSRYMIGKCALLEWHTRQLRDQRHRYIYIHTRDSAAVDGRVYAGRFRTCV